MPSLQSRSVSDNSVISEQIPFHQVTAGDSVIEKHQFGGCLLPQSLDARSPDLVLLLTHGLRRLAAGGRLAPLDAVLYMLHDVLHPAVCVLEARGQEVNVLPSLILHTDPLRVLPHQGAGAQLGRPPGLLTPPETETIVLAR